MASTDEESWFEQGIEAARNYYSSQAFAGGTDYIAPEVAIKLYLPPENEDLLQVARPMSKQRQKWIAGFRKEQLSILAKGIVEKRTKLRKKLRQELKNEE